MQGEGVLLLVVCWLVLAAPPLTALTPQCSLDADLVLGIGDVATVTASNTTKWLSFFLHPEDDFQGVTVEATGSHETTTVWFPSCSICFPPGSDWWRVQLGCTHDNDTPEIWCGMFAGRCRLSCKQERISEHLLSVRVMAHGASRWRSAEPLDTCVTSRSDESAPHRDYTCRDPPPSLKSTGFAGSSTTVAVVLAAVSVVVTLTVVAIVTKVRELRQRPKSSSSGIPITWSTQALHPKPAPLLDTPLGQDMHDGADSACLLLVPSPQAKSRGVMKT